MRCMLRADSHVDGSTWGKYPSCSAQVGYARLRLSGRGVLEVSAADEPA